MVMVMVMGKRFAHEFIFVVMVMGNKKFFVVVMVMGIENCYF